MIARALFVAAVLVPSLASAQPEEYVLLRCDAVLRASVLENTSQFRVPLERCVEDTRGQGAWQVQLLATLGDVVHVRTLGSDRAGRCSPGPRGLGGLQLEFYAPLDAVVPTLAEPLETRTRDKEVARLLPGVPLDLVRGPWRATAIEGAPVEVKVPRRLLSDRFARPRTSACASWVAPRATTPPAPREIAFVDPGSGYAVPRGAEVYLPTREQVGATDGTLRLSADDSFSQGLLRCHTVAAFEWALGGSAPLCFLELALTPQ